MKVFEELDEVGSYSKLTEYDPIIELDNAAAKAKELGITLETYLLLKIYGQLSKLNDKLDQVETVLDTYLPE